MLSHHRHTTAVRSSPTTALVVGIVVAVGLMLLPDGYSAALRQWAATALRPGQLGATAARQRVAEWGALAASHVDTAGKLAAVQSHCEGLERENRRLEAELEFLRQRGSSHGTPDAEHMDPLVKFHCLEARVLGQQARDFLSRRNLLDAGSQAGVDPGALVLGRFSPLVDCGGDAQVRSGQLVCALGNVWGKIADVGPWTSTVRTVTEPGYRDVVRLLGPSAAGSPGRSGPQGVLEGTGESLSRVRHVPVTEPAAVGDVVVSQAGQGLLANLLVCGRVVRVERTAGAAYWDIWMQPAVAAGQLDRVTVVRGELNRDRVAAARREIPE
jgi:cell shape-determining protein MreC